MKRRRTLPPFLRSMRRLRAAFWRRRVSHWLVRAAWLALLVPTIFAAGYLWLGWQVRWYYWVYPMLLVGFLSIIWSMRPITLRKITRRLDDRFELQAQLTTALDVSHISGDPAQDDNLVVQRLLQETVNIIANLRRHIHMFSRRFWLEMNALIGVAALLSALLIFDALTPRVPDATPVELPPSGQEPKADEVIPPDPQLMPPPFEEDIRTQMLSEDQLQRALQALADALRDRAITRAIAEAIDRGDLDDAAEGLRRLADQVGDLTEEARQGLGDSLQEAADNIGEEAPFLTQPLQAGSQALSEENLGAASQALEDLAEAVDSIDEAPQETAQVEPDDRGESDQADDGQQSQDQASEEQSEEQEGGSGNGAGQGDGPDQPTEEERLAIEGQPLELEADPEEIPEDSVVQPAELDAQASGKQTEDSPFARQSASAATDLGPDPLTYPWERREIIRRYFTP